MSRSSSSIRTALAGAGAIGLAGLIANVANILTTFALSHLLVSRQYGSFNVLVYIFLILTMPGYAVIVAVVRQLTIWKSNSEFENSKAIVARWRLLAIIITAGVFILSLIFGRHLSQELAVRDWSDLPPILVAGTGWLLLSIDRGIIQAELAYRNMARNLLVEGLVRTAVTLILVIAGLGVEGAMLGILASAVLADLDARLSIASFIGQNRPNDREHLADVEIAISGESPMPHFESSRYVVDFFVGLCGLAMLAALAGVDVVIIGHQDPGGSGSYAAIAVISKVLFFAALILSGYLLPEATSRWHKGQSALNPLVITLCILTSCWAALEVFSMFFARYFMKLVFPHRLMADVGHLPVLVAAMGLLGLSVIIVYYFMGIGRGEVLAILLLALVSLLVVVGNSKGRPGFVVRGDLIVQLGLFACLLAYLVFVSSRSSKIIEI